MLTSLPDFNGRANFDECLEAELFVRYHAYTIHVLQLFTIKVCIPNAIHTQKAIPGLEEHASKTKRYPRWPLALENVLRLKYPNQLSLGEHEQV